MRFFTKKILMSALLAIVVFCNPVYFSVQAQTPTAQDTDGSYTFLLKNPQQVKKFLGKLDVTNKKIKVIEEIGLIHIENEENDKNLKQEIASLSQELDNYISAEGELPKLKHTLDKPRVASSEDIEENKKEEIHGVQYPPLISPYFMPFNWYLEDVTNNYQSQLISKGENSSIALIDSGIDKDHPLLTDNINIKLGKNYTSDELDFNDEMGHGTSVAGILTSIAPDITVVPYKVLGAEDGESIWVLESIVDAVKDGNDIINMSLGTYKSRSDKEDRLLIEAYEAAIKYADKHGVVVVSAAGNLSKDLDQLNKNEEMYLPGNLKKVITVSSTTNIDTLASYSNYGKNIDFAAPGGDLNEDFDITGLILTTYPVEKANNFIDQAIGIPSGYTLSYGTSLAVPQVSATAALIISEYKKNNKKNPNVNKVKKYLREGASDIGGPSQNRYFGDGKINAYQTLINMK